MRFTLHLNEGEALKCGSCEEWIHPGQNSFIGDPEDAPFIVLCSTCLDLEEAAIADGIEFTGVTNPQNPTEEGATK